MQKVPSIRKLLADNAIKKVHDYNDAVTINKDKLLKVSLTGKMASANTLSSNNNTKSSEDRKTINQERRSKNRIYLKSISTKMAMERTSGKKNEPMTIVMKS